MTHYRPDADPPRRPKPDVPAPVAAVAALFGFVLLAAMAGTFGFVAYRTFCWLDWLFTR